MIFGNSLFGLGLLIFVFVYIVIASQFLAVCKKKLKTQEEL